MDAAMLGVGVGFDTEVCKKEKEHQNQFFLYQFFKSYFTRR